MLINATQMIQVVRGGLSEKIYWKRELNEKERAREECSMQRSQPACVRKRKQVLGKVTICPSLP